MERVTTVYLSLGSNLGDRAENLRSAVAALPGLGLRVTQKSSLFETEPVDYLEQGWFLNCVVAGESAGRVSWSIRGDSAGKLSLDTSITGFSNCLPF